MNRLALPPTDMFIGHHVLIGTSMGRGCLCRNNALAPLIPFLRAVWLTLTPTRAPSDFHQNQLRDPQLYPRGALRKNAAAAPVGALPLFGRLADSGPCRSLIDGAERRLLLVGER
jgi:hypothetical protein